MDSQSKIYKQLTRARDFEQSQRDALGIIDSAIHEIVADTYRRDMSDDEWEQSIGARNLLIDAQNYLAQS